MPVSSEKAPNLHHLESRILFSASPIAALAIPQVGDAVQVVQEIRDVANDNGTQFETTSDLSRVFNQRTEIVLIDSRVDEIDLLVAELNPSDVRHIEYFVLDENRDGIDQISELLAAYDEIDAVHIVSHGSDRGVQLGNSTLEQSLLGRHQGYTDKLSAWGGSLSENADILFYGCNLAERESGQQLMASIAEFTGANVAASDDATGHNNLNGDWTLEFSVGLVETEVVFGEAVQSSWTHLLATNTAPVLSTSQDLGLTTVDTTLPSGLNNGNSVVEILASGDGSSPISDPDSGAVAGIAINFVADNGGHWEFSVDGGGTWNDVDADGAGLTVVSDSNALLLTADVAEQNRIRFTSDAPQTATREFGFRAWDATESPAVGNGNYANISATGGATAFSTSVETASVDLVQDTAPTISVTGSTSATAGNSYTLTIDVDDPNSNTIRGWTVVWGDGQVEHFAGAGTSVGATQRQLQLTHTYANPGLYDILVSVTDDVGTHHNSTIVANSQDSDELFFYSSDGTFQNVVGADVSNPIEVIHGPDGFLYVTSFETAGEVRRYDASTGAFVDVYFNTMPSGGNGGAMGMAFDGSGNLYVSYYDLDGGANDDSLIWKVSAKNTGAVFIDNLALRDKGPSDLAFGPDGALYVANFKDLSVDRYDAQTGVFLGNFVPTGANGLINPSTITFGDDDHLYLVGQFSKDLSKYDSSGALVWQRSHEQITNTSSPSGAPRGITVGPDGLLYVSHSSGTAAQNQVHVLDASDGSYVETFIDAGGLANPRSILFTPATQVAVTSHATLQIDTDEVSQASDGEGPLLSYTPSSSDLTQNGSSAVSSNTLSGSTALGDTDALGNGSLDDAAGGVYLRDSTGGGNLPNSQTIVFDTSVNTAGYEISGITTYAGHSINGSGLANQRYTLEYSLVGDSNFVSLGEISHIPYDDSNTDPAAATRIQITDSTGTIATGVDAIRITYLSHGFNNVNASVDGTLYKELDVFGVALSPAVITVTTTADENDGDTSSIEALSLNPGGSGISLREAILAANNTTNLSGGPDVIQFNISGTAPHTITPTSELPSITEAVLIDGWSEPDFASQAGTADPPTGEIWLTGNTTMTAGGISFDENEIVKFGDSDDTFSLTGTTSGTFEKLANFVGPNNIRGLHFVETDITVGNAPNSFDLQRGDLLVSFSNNSTTLNQGQANQFNATRQDIVVFRPSSTTNYDETAGEWFMLLDDAIELSGSAQNIHALALVEKDTVVGDTTINRGQLVVAHGSQVHDVRVVTVHSAGSSSSASVEDLISGLALGTNSQLQGLHLVQQTTQFGDAVVEAGTILVQVNFGGTVAGVDFNVNDVIALDVSQTERGAGTAATGAVLFHGDDLPLNAFIDGFTMVSSTFDAGATAFDSGNVIQIDGANLAANGLTIADSADGTTIRGLVIRDFGLNGILIDTGAENNTIVGNFIGSLNASGDNAGIYEMNGNAGIRILGSNNTIGGTGTNERNVLSGNTFSGVQVGGDNNTLIGNHIGVDIAGDSVIANDRDGIRVFGTGTTVGGRSTGQGNIIGGNGERGIAISDNSSDNSVLGNYIGTNATETANLGNNGRGIAIFDNASNNQIGGINSGEGNVIANNGSDGVVVGSTNQRNSIRGNRFSSNGNRAIDLNYDGVTANDSGDVDGDANGTQNYPVITLAQTDGTDLFLNGTFDTIAGSTYDIDVYAITSSQDSSGHGEADRYLGSFQLSPTGSPSAFSATIANANVSIGDLITATATDPLGNTSEFSANLAATSVRPVVVLNAADLDFTENDPATIIDGAASVTDVDSANFDGGNLSVFTAFFAGATPNGIEFSIRDEGTDPGQIGISGSDVTFGGTVIGTFTPGTAFAQMTVDFNSNANPTSVSALLRNVTFYSSHENPSSTPIEIVFQISDGQGGTGYSPVKLVNLIAVNDAPTLGNGTLAAVDEDATSPLGDTVANIFSGQFSDVDSDSFSGIAVVSNPDVASEGTWEYSINGTDWDPIGTVDDSGNALFVDETARIRFRPTANFNGTPTGLTVRGLDGTGTINIDVNGRETVDTSAPSSTAGFSQSTATLSTSVTPQPDAPQGDVTVSGNPAEGQTLTVSDTLSDADGLGTITYHWFRDGSDTGATGASYTLGSGDVGALISVIARYTDGSGSDESVASNSLGPVGAAPQLTGLESTFFRYIAGNAPVTLTDTISISDLDSTTLVSATIDLAGHLPNQDVLSFVDTATISGSWNATTGVMMLTGTDTLAAYEAAIRSVTFHNTEAVPEPGRFWVHFSVNDGVVESNVARRNIQVLRRAEIVNTNVPIVVEGDIDLAWNAATSNEIDVRAGGIAASSSDSSGSWKALYDAANLYILVEVQDDVIVVDNPGSAFRDDSIEIFLDGDFSANTSYDGVNDYQFLISGSDGAFYTSVNSLASPAGTQISHSSTATGYQIEFAIPISDLDALPVVGSEIGMELYLNDDDDGGERDTRSAWQERGDLGYTNPSSFGFAEFVAFTNTSPTGDVTISGAAINGETLTASNTISDPDGVGPISYQWRRNGSDIAGATNTSYVLTDDDVGANISVVASYTDGQATVESLTSGDLGPVVDPPDLTGIETIDATLIEGQGSVTISNSIEISDFDSSTISSALVRISSGFVSGQGQLEFADTGTITGSWNSATGTLTLSGTDSVAAYEAALRSIQYNHLESPLEPTAVHVSFTVNDGVLNSNSVGRDLQVIRQANIVETQVPIIVDGQFDLAWHAAKINEIDLVDFGSVTSTSDLSGNWRALWDASNLYVLFEVQDDSVVADSPANFHRDDSIELFLDGDSSRLGSYDSINDFQFQMRVTDPTVKLGPNSAALPAGTQFVQSTTTSGYRFEFAIPIADLQTVASVGSILGVDVYLNDDDDGGSSEAQLVWNDSAGNAGSTNPASFGSAILTAFTNTPVSGDVTISGSLIEDQTLTASNTFVDPDGIGTVNYQWKRNGVDIVGASDAVYTLTDEDVGHRISVEATYTDGQGTLEGNTSLESGPVVNVNDVPTGNVIITGTTTEDQVLTVSDTLNDDDGLGTITYHWQRDGVDTGITGSTFTLDQIDVGSSISVDARYTDARGTAESVNSGFHGPVANLNDVPNGNVTVAGTPLPGSVLTATNDLTDEDGLGPIAYQWQRNGIDLSGETAAVYQLTVDDVGSVVTVVATYKDGYKTDEQVVSLPVSINGFPPPTTSPPSTPPIDPPETPEPNPEPEIEDEPEDPGEPSPETPEPPTETTPTGNPNDGDDDEIELGGLIQSVVYESPTSQAAKDFTGSPSGHSTQSVNSRLAEARRLRATSQRSGFAEGLSQEVSQELLMISTPGGLWNDMNKMSDEMQISFDAQSVFVGSAVTGTAGLTVGYIIWTIRSGVLFSTFVAQMPAWRLIDPIVVMSSSQCLQVQDDVESIESIAEGRAAELDQPSTSNIKSGQKV